MKRAILTLLSVLVFSNVAYGYILEVNWVHGSSPVEYSLPEPQTTTSLVPFSVNLDWVVYRNQYEAEQALGGSPTLSINRSEKEIFLEFLGPPSAPFSTAYDPVCGLRGHFGPLEEGEWVFVFRFQGYLLWDNFDVIPGEDGGVKAEYFEGLIPQGNSCLTLIEPRIDNNWGSNVVACGLSNQVSARWTANLEITEDDTYTFATNSDDGVLLWLNGASIIDNWTDHSPTINTSLPLQLQRGVYALRMEWYENSGGAVAQLFWETPTMPRQIIPPGPLQPPPPRPQEGVIPVGTGVVFESFEHYNDNVAAGQAIFQTWIGGPHPAARPFDIDNGSSMRVGHLTPPYAEQTTVYSGRQSMPLYYNNSQGRISQADRTWDTPQNWVAQGLEYLSLQVHGQPKYAETETDEGEIGFVLSGAGTDIWGTYDEFRFAHKRINGDCRMTARIVDNGSGSNNWAKGGVMIRESLQRGSKHAMAVLTGGSGGGAAFQWRPTTNGVSYTAHDPTPSVSPPYWVRIGRVGNNFSAYLSRDGVTWRQQGQTQTINMAQTVYIGMCVTSHASDELRTFEFDNVSTNPQPIGQTGVEDVGVDQPGNEPSQLYLTVKDIFEREVQVDHPDPDILLSPKWEEWNIPLEVFADQGIDLTMVKTISIGMRELFDEPQIGSIKPMATGSGGSGVLFTDYGTVTPNPAGTSSVNLLGYVWKNFINTSLIPNAKMTLTPVHGQGGISKDSYAGICWLKPTYGEWYNISVTAPGYQSYFHPEPKQFTYFTSRMDVPLKPVP